MSEWLLTDEERMIEWDAWKEVYGSNLNVDMDDWDWCLAKAQDTKTASIKDAECQARVEAIFADLTTVESLELGRKAIEDTLIEWRDNRLSLFNRGNGLVIREKDGKDSSIIRFGPETALQIGIKVIVAALKQKYGGEK